MKTTIASVTAFAVASCFASLAMAIDNDFNMSIKDGLEAGKHTKERLSDDVALYFGNQKTPPVAKKIGEWDSVRKSTKRTRQEACDTAFVSVLLSLQQRARREGGNAVINIGSGNGSGAGSSSEYVCTAGRFTSSVHLRGTVVTLKK